MDKRSFINFVARLKRINKFVDDLSDLGINMNKQRMVLLIILLKIQ